MDLASKRILSAEAGCAWISECIYLAETGSIMATVKVQVVKWGNSHAVRLPKVVLEKAEMRNGDQLEIRVEKGRIALEPVRAKLNLQDLVARITPENLHDEQDWGKPVGREVW
jgi:antitoxin MazE